MKVKPKLQKYLLSFNYMNILYSMWSDIYGNDEKNCWYMYTIINLFMSKTAFVGMMKIKSIYKLRIVSRNPLVKPNYIDSLTQLAKYMYKCHHPVQMFPSDNAIMLVNSIQCIIQGRIQNPC